MTIEPEVRTSVVRDVHSAITTSFPAWEPLLDPTVRRRLDVMSPDAWVPAHWLFSVEDAVLHAFGADAVRSLRRRAATLTTESPLLQPIREGAASIAVASPRNLLRWAPGARAMGMRGLGHATYEETATGARLRIRGAPPQLLASKSWRPGSEGALLGVLDISRSSGAVVSFDEQSDVVFDVSWPDASGG